jgi:hypothetical protein
LLVAVEAVLLLQEISEELAAAALVDIKYLARNL